MIVASKCTKNLQLVCYMVLKFNMNIIILFFLKKLGDRDDYCLVPVEFLKKLNGQNKAIWKKLIKQDKKLDDIKKDVSKLQRENSLSPAFFDVSIKNFKDFLVVNLCRHFY